MDLNRRRLYQLSIALEWDSAEIAEVLGVSQRTVQRFWIEFRIRKPQPSEVLTRERLEFLYNKDDRNLSLDELGEICPWSRRTVATYVKKAELSSKQWREQPRIRYISQSLEEVV